MTNLTAGDQAEIQMSTFPVDKLLTGTYSAASATAFKVDIGDGHVVTYSGAGFTFDGAGHLLGGTVTGLAETSGGAPVLTITGMNVDAASYVQWSHDADSTAALDAMFGGDDSMVGASGDDYLTGLNGHDIILGHDGADTLLGGDGNDHIYGQSASGGPDGADSISGGDGSDYIQGNAGNDTLDGGSGSDRINGGANNDSITGGIGADTVNGNLGSDTIDGGEGNDSLRGGKDADSVNGGSGDDVVMGDIGNDIVVGGAGLDLLTGGADADTFRFAAGDATFARDGVSAYAADTVTDYVDGTDHIALGFTVSSMLMGASQSSVSAAATAAQQLFDDHAGNGEVAAIQVGSDTYLFFAGDGGAIIDSAIRAQAVTSASFATPDFV
ncbi:MAG TPA: calcium-binding protein [Sphingomonas sp.]|nr:calcium-binding protein [Sphingomonas sp.]